MKTILYLEDNGDDVYLLRRALARAGVDVQMHVTTSAQETIAYIRGQPPYNDRAAYPSPDLVMIDLHIPGDDSLGVLTGLRQGPASGSPQVVVVSDSASPAHARQATELGADRFFIKPQDHSQWVAFLRHLLFNHDPTGT